MIVEIHKSTMSKSFVFCLLVVMTTVVRYSYGQCTTKYCEEGEEGLYKNFMEQSQYLLQEIRRIGQEVEKNTEMQKQQYASLQEKQNELENELKQVKSQQTSVQVLFNNCAEVYKSGLTQSGIYSIKPALSKSVVNVYCDHSDGGGWTVFQRRVDGTLMFNRTWVEYKNGFGDLNREFWLGNDLVSTMTSGTDSTLRLDMMDFNGETRYAVYTNFKVSPESDNYRLQIGTYSGTAGDSPGLSYQNGQQFSTIDQDNDGSISRDCAATWGGAGGWWYKECAYVNFNGFYRNQIQGNVTGTHEYMIWEDWKGSEQLKKTEMKFRPSNF